MIFLGLLCNFFTTKIAFLYPSDEGTIIIYHTWMRMRSIFRDGPLIEPGGRFENSLTKEITKSILSPDTCSKASHPSVCSVATLNGSHPELRQDLVGERGRAELNRTDKKGRFFDKR